MVRVNLIHPRHLSDQHLVAEYYEILMLVKYIRKHPNIKGIPESFRLGPGHMVFFKDKVLYLQKRHKHIVSEMRRRGFAARLRLDVVGINDENLKDWNPNISDISLIKNRLKEKILMKEDGFYRYYGVPLSREKMVSIVESA